MMMMMMMNMTKALKVKKFRDLYFDERHLHCCALPSYNIFYSLIIASNKSRNMWLCLGPPYQTCFCSLCI